MTFYPRMLAPMIYLYRIVTSGAGPRAVGTERGRWSDWEMSDTCSTHRSRVPRRRSGGYKRGATTVKDERGPGLGFILCLVFVCARQSTVRGCRAILCLFWLLKFYLNVRRFPPPSSREYEVFYYYTGAETREEGGTRCRRSLAAGVNPRCRGAGRSSLAPWTLEAVGWSELPGTDELAAGRP